MPSTSSTGYNSFCTSRIHCVSYSGRIPDRPQPLLCKTSAERTCLSVIERCWPLKGFPAEYLPIEVSRTTNDTLSLTLPLEPSDYHEIKRTITLSPEIAPRGIELIASMATRIYENSKDTANLMIRERTDDRMLPYTNFEFITQPNLQPRAKLTPLKVGIVSCWILRQCLAAESWPGQIKAVVWDAISKGGRHALDVGTLSIMNSPLHDTASQL